MCSVFGACVPAALICLFVPAAVMITAAIYCVIGGSGLLLAFLGLRGLRSQLTAPRKQLWGTFKVYTKALLTITYCSSRRLHA